MRLQSCRPAGKIVDAGQPTGEQAAPGNLGCRSRSMPLPLPAAAAAARWRLHQAPTHEQCTHLPVLLLQLLQVDGVRVQVAWGRQQARPCQ